MGVRVKIMLPHDPTGVNGVKKVLSDVVEIFTPKEDKPAAPRGMQQQAPQQQAAAPVVVQQQQAAAPAQSFGGGFNQGGY